MSEDVIDCHHEKSFQSEIRTHVKCFPKVTKNVKGSKRFNVF